MPLKIMCAGCSKDEREPAEASVKAALAGAAGSWTVSLVKIGRQWSMTVDGPDIKHKTQVVPEGGIKQAIQQLLPGAAPPPASLPAPAPAAAPAARTARPAPRAAAPASRPVSASRPAPSAAASRPRPAAGRTPATRASGERQDRYDCRACGAAFLVIYESSGSASQETVAVACPHCWKNSHVMVSEEAAISRDYRSEKA
jgi:hypothetical protein